MPLHVNYDIAVTHIVTRKKQTIVAALGVLIGVAAFLFLNSLSAGFDRSSKDAIFQANAHIQIYKKDEISIPIVQNQGNLSVILNPQITTLTKTLVNPNKLLEDIRKEEERWQGEEISEKRLGENRNIRPCWSAIYHLQQLVMMTTTA